jgi:Ca2+-binding EF-hand superfamily protein
MRARHLALCGLFVFLSSCGSRPPQPPRWNPYAAGPPREEIVNGGPIAAMKRYDANSDGVITREELLARLRAEFAAADTAKTGCLGEAQVAGINQQRIETDKSTATPLQDWNQDGCVNFQEFATAPVSLFDQFDRNGDGRITAQELDPRAAGRGAPGSAAEAPPEGTEEGRDGRGGRGGRGGPPP